MPLETIAELFRDAVLVAVVLALMTGWLHTRSTVEAERARWRSAEDREGRLLAAVEASTATIAGLTAAVEASGDRIERLSERLAVRGSP